MAHTLEPKEARKLMRVCSSARRCHFHGHDGTSIKAVSVAERDSERPEVVKILQGRETLWPPGGCNEGMTMWIAMRTWYPIAEG